MAIANETSHLSSGLPHSWDALSDGFSTRMLLVVFVMGITVSIFLAIAAFGPKNRFYQYRPTETNDKFLNVDLDEDGDEEADVLFDAGRHKLLRKSSQTV